MAKENLCLSMESLVQHGIQPYSNDYESNTLAD